VTVTDEMGQERAVVVSPDADHEGPAAGSESAGDGGDIHTDGTDTVGTDFAGTTDSTDG